MANINHNANSIQFPLFASKLEAHLIKHGVPCSDADIIIEESSVLYFERLRSPKNCSIR